MRFMTVLAFVFAFLTGAIRAEGPAHDHPAPERLGTVHFQNSCSREVQPQLQRAIALLHSFAYGASAKEFAQVGDRDPECAIAHWGAAMSLYHPLWSAPSADELARGQVEVERARRIGARTLRERELTDAAAVYFSDTDPTHHGQRAQSYLLAMQSVAQHFPNDDETQIFYALALIATAPPTDRTHANQKRAADILEPIYRRQPDHPGAAHYLIHAYDSSELAPRGLGAARAYAKIAPAAPHALHMPSHIFTRLGLWDDSIESNLAARQAAHDQGDIGEELHAMDYLTYAYLQRGRDADAERLVALLQATGTRAVSDFKVSYAATAMPVRLAVERERWNDAQALVPLSGSPPHVAALVYWAQALAHSHTGQADLAEADIVRIEACRTQLLRSGDEYWAAQVDVLSHEARGWNAKARGDAQSAVRMLREAADSEDALEKLPVTPGPIVPAREQLGRLLLEQGSAREALQEFTQALQGAPRRRAALEGAVRAANAAGTPELAATFSKQL